MLLFVYKYLALYWRIRIFSRFLKVELHSTLTLTLTPQAEAKSEHGTATLPITVRQLEAISRIAESFAKMQQRDEVLKYHVEQAMELFTAATMEASTNSAMGEWLLRVSK